MAAAATPPNSWRFVFGSTEQWAQPECSPSGVPILARGDPTWRVIFGDTLAWLPPQLDSPAASATDLCELCRQPIRQDEDFVTNSAGERPAHIRCLGQQSPAPSEQESAPHGWFSMLRNLLTS